MPQKRDGLPPKLPKDGSFELRRITEQEVMYYPERFGLPSASLSTLLEQGRGLGLSDT